MSKGQPVSQSQFKFTKSMVTGLPVDTMPIHSMMLKALSARGGGFRKITIQTSLPVLEVLVSANGCRLSVGYGEPFFAG